MDLSFQHASSSPYVGTQYGVIAPFQVRIMILGESHYHGGPLRPEFTTEVVLEAMNGSSAPSLRFFAKTVGSFFGSPQDIERRRDFLRTVAFYNFIQEPLPGPKVRPSSEMWIRAIPACTEVLQKLEPQFVLVLGRELWNHLSLPFRNGPSVILPDGQVSTSRLYELPSGTLSFFFPIKHPSSPGWSYKEWCPWVKAAIQEAINASRPG